jgi:signal transduction histidine kinase
MLTSLIHSYRASLMWQMLLPLLALLVLCGAGAVYLIDLLALQGTPERGDLALRALWILWAAMLVIAGAGATFLLRRLILRPQRQMLVVLKERMKGNKAFSRVDDAGAFGMLSDALNQALRMNDQVDQLKNEFMPNVRQELRAPLASIRGSLNMILDSESMSMSEKVRRLLELAERNSEQLSVLIGEILDLQAFASGNPDFLLRTLDLTDLARQAIAANEHDAVPRDIRLLLTHCPPQAPVRGDEQRLAQVFANLLSNAIRFSPSRRSVEIAIVLRDEWYRVSVRDHGPGIPESLRPRLFRRFLQVDASGSHKQDRAGLGLGVSQAIVEYHGGSIGYENRADGGCEFYFELKRYEGRRL